MTWMLFIAVGLAAVWALNVFWLKGDLGKLARSAQYVIGGLAAAVALFLILRGRVDIGALVGAGAFSILRYGRLGPISFQRKTPSADNRSSVRSRYIAMQLDHATGAVTGRVIYGEFQGFDLADLDEFETRRLLSAIANDPDSLSLLETWLDRNRAGWREYFAEQDGPGGSDGGGTSGESEDDLDRQAYEILGIEPGASADEIRAAHRKLMKGVHPDQGGSNYLASRINEAKERLLRRVRS